MHKIDNPYWNKGYDAYTDGLSRDDNPYEEVRSIRIGKMVGILLTQIMMNKKGQIGFDSGPSGRADRGRSNGQIA